MRSRPASLAATRTKTKKRLALGGALVIALAAFPALAGAAADPDPGQTVTGCLNSARIVAVKVGTSPNRPCTSTEKLVRLANGDITSVRAVAGGGIKLNGPGFTGSVLDPSGQVQLGLFPGFKLPQTCVDGQVPEKSGPTWTCLTPANNRILYGRASGDKPVPNQMTYVAKSLVVPAGTWSISAKINFHAANSGEDRVDAGCRLDLTGNAGVDGARTYSDGSIFASSQIVLTTAVTRSEPFNVTVACSDTGLSETNWDTLHVIAVEGQSITNVIL